MKNPKETLTECVKALLRQGKEPLEIKDLVNKVCLEEYYFPRLDSRCEAIRQLWEEGYREGYESTKEEAVRKLVKMLPELLAEHMEVPLEKVLEIMEETE